MLHCLACILQVNIVSCDGKCPSASIYNYNINTYARFCKCCRETGLQRRSVQLYCSSNSTWVSYSIQEPTDCSCQWSWACTCAETHAELYTPSAGSKVLLQRQMAALGWWKKSFFLLFFVEIFLICFFLLTFCFVLLTHNAPLPCK